MKKIYSLMFTSYPGWTWGQTELRKLTKLLKDLEWSNRAWDEAECPSCGREKNYDMLSGVHKATCKLAKTLKDLGVEVQIEKVGKK